MLGLLLRVYVQREVYEDFLAKLAEQARSLVVGDPTRRDVFVGPVIDGAAVDRFEAAVKHASEAGRVVWGGEVLRGRDGYGEGNYLAPTVMAPNLPARRPALRATNSSFR